MDKNVTQSGIPQLRPSKPSHIPTFTTARQSNNDNKEKIPQQEKSPAVSTSQRPSLLKNLFTLKASAKEAPHTDPGITTRSECPSGASTACSKNKLKIFENKFHVTSPKRDAPNTASGSPLASNTFHDFSYGLSDCSRTGRALSTAKKPNCRLSECNIAELTSDSVCSGSILNVLPDLVPDEQRTAECAPRSVSGGFVVAEKCNVTRPTRLPQTFKCSQQSTNEFPRHLSETFLVDEELTTLRTRIGAGVQPCDNDHTKTASAERRRDSDRSNRTSEASDLDATLTENNVNTASKNGASSPTSPQTSSRPQIETGQKVKVCGHQVGTVRYVGSFHRAHGVFCGVELDEPVGLNDGTVDGKRYFLCRKKYGIIAPMDKVSPLAPPGACRVRRDTFCIPKSGPESLLSTTAECEAVSIDSENFLPIETQHELYKSPPSTPGSVNTDWSNLASSQVPSTPPNCHSFLHELSKHNSFEQDESLGILSPDQMKTDLTMYGDVTTLPPYRHWQQPDDFQWARFADLTCETSLLDNQECPIYLHDALDESRESFLAVLQPVVEDGKKPPTSLPLKIGDCMKMSLDVFTPASTQADISDRTLSPEDLPLDEVCDPQVDLKVLDTVEASEFTGSVSAEPSSRSSAPPVSSFVASITSITSLDNGYQGDGECSRPGSRGPDHYSPTAGHRPALASALRVKGGTGQDPMTDSDFFTESDADVHEELSAVTGRGRGDRKAQVIDGTLYGSDSHSSASQSNGGATVLFSNGPQQQHQRCPSFTASVNEEMESSGVYSDLERKSDEQADCPLKILPPDSDTLVAVQPDCSPDASTKTSSRSDHSQVKDTFPGSAAMFPETVVLDATVVMRSVIPENVKVGQVADMTPNSVAKSPELVCNTLTDASMAEQNGEAFPKTAVPAVEGKLGKPDGPYLIKKYKMPKRNVVSKVKTMIDSHLGAAKASDGTDDRENKRPVRTKSPKKGGRWDAVMSKIAQGQAENKWTPTKLKDVKSKVLLNITPPPPPLQSHHSVGLHAAGVARKGSLLLPGNRQSQDNTLKSKSRRNRTRASSSSLSQAQAGILNSSLNSSAHSSVSDLSVDHAQRTLCKTSNKSNTSLGTSKKREVGRSTSPLSDGSTNSATSHVITRQVTNHHPTPGLPRQSPRSGEERARDSGATNPQKRQPRNVRSLAANGSKRMQTLMGRRATPSEEKNGVSAQAAADMKTPVRKVASRRAPATVQKSSPTPLRDHNSRQQQATSGATKAPEVAHAPRKVSALPPQPSPEERLLPLLRHNATGFEALSVLVQYLVFDLEAFATPQLRRNLEQLNGEWVRTRLELEEAQVSYRRLGEEMCQKVVAHHQELEQAASSYHQQLADMKVAHGHELDQICELHAAQIADVENQHQQVVSKQRAATEDQRHELLAQLDQVRQESEVLAQDAARRDAEHHKATQEAAAREVELHQRLAAVDKENREEWRRVMEDLRKDKDSKLQVTAGRCKELQDEVQSLQTVLELRSQEMQDLRRQNAELSWAAEEVQSARQRIQSLQAREEDLQAQLLDKTTFVRQLSQENKHLLELLHEESKQKERLSQHNEELQYKLKQSKEYMLAALSTSLRSTSSSSDSYKTPGVPDHHSAPLQHLTEPPAFLQLPLHGDNESSPPQSPKVKSMVQKGDSVSWTLAMEEAPEIYSRLIRRAGSFRGTTSSLASGCASSPVRSRTLPPPKRQRCKASSLCLSSSAAAISPRQNQGSSGSFSIPSHARSRSVSADSADDVVDMEAYDWVSGSVKRNLLEDFGNGDEVTLESLEQHGRDKMEDCGKVPGLGDGSSMKRSSPSESSNEADSPSKSSTSSSGSSNGPIQNGKGSEHLRGHRRKKGSCSQLNLVSSASESMDNTDPEVLPLPPLPGSSSSSDLSLLAACSVVQNSKMPKESGGEAMISEETSEDENQRDVVNSSSDEHSSSDDDSSSSSLEMVSTGNAVFIKSENGTVMCGQGNTGIGGKLHKSQYQRLLQSGSGSMLAGSDTVDVSWSEDLELMPSESEG